MRNAPLFLIILTFVVPFIAAQYVFHKKDRFKFTTTYSGQMLTEKINILNKKLDQWTWVYVKPKTCNAECQKNLKTFENMQISLGKFQNKVQQIVTSKNNLNLKKENMLKDNDILIIDNHGNLILKYDEHVDKRNIVKDLKHLVKINA